jgi:hypothetical protein
MSKEIAKSRDELRSAARISEELAEDMWSPSATVQSIGCLHDTITDARQALADFWVGETVDIEQINHFELKELQDFLCGVQMNGRYVECSEESARDIAEDYLGLEIID